MFEEDHGAKGRRLLHSNLQDTQLHLAIFGDTISSVDWCGLRHHHRGDLVQLVSGGKAGLRLPLVDFRSCLYSASNLYHASCNCHWNEERHNLHESASVIFPSNLLHCLAYQCEMYKWVEPARWNELSQIGRCYLWVNPTSLHAVVPYSNPWWALPGNRHFARAEVWHILGFYNFSHNLHS